MVVPLAELVEDIVILSSRPAVYVSILVAGLWYTGVEIMMDIAARWDRKYNPRVKLLEKQVGGEDSSREP